MNKADASLPRVSLVTPAYNQAEYLAATVESVLAQTYPNIEYLVVDDGSTDATEAVLRSLDGRVRWVRQENCGQARTLNLAWTKSHGEILGYLSSDDLLRPDAVAAAVAALAAHPTAVACYCDFDLIDEFDRRVRSVRTEDYSRLRLVRDLVCLPGPGAFFRRHAFEQSGGWNPDLRQIPDFDFFLRLSRLGDFVRIPEILAAYRIHPESASYRQITARQSDEIIRAVADYWRESAPAASFDAPASNAMAHLLSARSHLSSGRTAQGVLRVLQAWRMAPMRAFQTLPWRILFGGLVRRTYYGLRSLRVAATK